MHIALDFNEIKAKKLLTANEAIKRVSFTHIYAFRHYFHVAIVRFNHDILRANTFLR